MTDTRCRDELERRRKQRQKLRDGIISRDTHVRTNRHTWRRPLPPKKAPTYASPPTMRASKVCARIGHDWPKRGIKTNAAGITVRQPSSICHRCGKRRARP